MIGETALRRHGDFSWLEGGRGPVILALHGLFGAPSDWEHVIAHFSTSYRVIAPALPVYTLPRASAHVDEIVRYVDRFVQHLQLTEAHVVGHSLGGQIAVLLAASSEWMRTLTLTGSSGLGENSFVGGLLRSGSSPRRADYALVHRVVASTFHDSRHATRELVEAVYAVINHSPDKVANIIAIIKSAKRREIGADLARLRHPACLIWGKDDLITPAAVAAEFHRRCATSELFWIDRCGHAPMIEQPAAFNQILGGWLRRRDQVR